MRYELVNWLTKFARGTELILLTTKFIVSGSKGTQLTCTPFVTLKPFQFWYHCKLETQAFYAMCVFCFHPSYCFGILIRAGMKKKKTANVCVT